MTDRRSLLLASPALMLGAATASAATQPLVDALRDTEIAFAATMAARDLAAFTRFIAPDTVWMKNDREPLIGRAAVVEAWRAYFDGPTPPFSWAPDLALLLPDGSLGRTSGPVTNAAGAVILRFNTVWRRKAEGGWEVVFDWATKA